MCSRMRIYTNSWVGGGLNAKLLGDRLKPDTDVYSPGNPVIFTIGPLTGTKSPVGGRFTAGARSPLTGGYGVAFAGSSFGPAMRWSGMQAMVITGASTEPVYLVIKGDKVEFKDAGKVWGRQTFEAQDMIKEELGDPKAEIACIGPAGENLVKYAAIIAGRRAAARGGIAAVMGSKKLKAVVLSEVGEPDFGVARPDEFKQAAKEALLALAHNPVCKTMNDMGSSFTLDVVHKVGILPTRNFKEGVFEDAHLISGQRLKEEFRVRKTGGCWRCPVGCESHVRVTEGEYAGAETRGLEYETMFALGSNCGNSSLENIIFMDMYCDQLGLDTMSLGVTISFAMECYEKGLLTKEDLGGIELTWGNHQAIKELTGLIARREGIGDLLAEGSAIASQKIKGAEGLAMHVKGLEMGGYDPRGAKGQGLSFATSTRGGCHHAGGYIIGPEVFAGVVDRFATEGKAGLVKGCRNSRIVFDCAIMCTFTTGAMGWEFPVRLLSGAIGKDFSEEELQQVANRVADTEREINLMYGIGREEDTLPQRFLTEPMPAGPSVGQVVELDKMMDEYYQINGWGN